MFERDGGSARRERGARRSREIHTAHLLLGILVKTQGPAFKVLHEAGVPAAELRSLLARRSAE
jgi:hypothetical protein